MGTELKMQPALIHVPAQSDLVFTPGRLAKDMVDFFQPSGLCLDPCAGHGAFIDLLPRGSEWCEISKGRDFYAWDKHVDWCIGNPPYSHYAAWIRHSMKVAENIVYLIPVYKIFASDKFLDDLSNWGGIRHIRRYGTGTKWGFPFGHALAAVYFQREYVGPTAWSRY